MSGEMADNESGERLYVLYGSETGNAESIAKRVHHDAITTHGFADAECMTLNEAAAKKLFDTQLTEDTATSLCVVIVCSTTGDGEPPQNAARFRRWLRNTSGTLHRIRYCLLALGDTNYSNFCAPGIFMDNKLSGMGAVRCYPRGEADDGVGLHLIVNPWVEGLWTALKKSITERTAAIGHKKYTTGETRIDMSVTQVAAILYSHASPLCAATALFLYERITELGGKVDLYPIQYFHPRTSLNRPPKVLFFVLCAEYDTDTLCEEYVCNVLQPPSLGLLSSWIGSSDSCAPPPAEAAELQRWMADPSICFFNSLFVSRSPGDASRASVLDANLKAIAESCKLEFLCPCQLSGEVPSVAISEKDVFLWIEKVLGSLPGVTASAGHIHQSVKRFFDNQVGLAFRAAQVPECRKGHGVESDDDVTSGSSDAKHTFSRNDASGGAGGSRRPNEVLDDLFTPIVFLYSASSPVVKRCAMELFSGARRHHLHSSIGDLSHFHETGFPRGATFVFVLSGLLTKSLMRVLRVLRRLQSQGKHVVNVNFAILGIDKTSQSDRFNACALELETLLLEMKAKKIHCTGLADVDSGALAPFIQSWGSNIWGAIVHPMKNATYMDMASPEIQMQHSVALLETSARSAVAALSLDGAPAKESVDRSAGDTVGGSDSNGLLAPSVFEHWGSASASPSLPPFLGRADPSRAADLEALSRVGASVSSLPDEVITTTTMASGATPGFDVTDTTTASTDVAGGFFRWDTISLPKENTRRTPIVFMYASAGMSKTMATHAMRSAEAKGFPAAIHAFANFQFVDYHAYPNFILFCEGAPHRELNDGGRFKKFLTNPLHRRDMLSHVRFAVLGIRATPANVVHPAFWWAKLLSRLHAKCVFPVLIMPYMSQLHSLGMPWVNYVLSSMAVVVPSMMTGAPFGHSDARSTTELANWPVEMSASAAPSIGDGDVSASAVDPQRCIVFLFDSSTEITESIARDFLSEALKRGFYSRVAALKYFQEMNFLSTANVILLCSTIATSPDGFPRDARRFARFLLAKDQPSTLLSGTSFAVLGLGKGSATTLGPAYCCRTAALFDHRMEELGGHRLCEVGMVDASKSIAVPVAAWRSTLFAALDAHASERTAGPLLFAPGDDPGGRHRTMTSAKGVAGNALHPPRRVVLAYCCAPGNDAVEAINYVVQTMAKSASVVLTVCTLNQLLQRSWRSKFDVVVFILGQSEGEEFPFSGSDFARLLWQDTAPPNMFAAVSYTVLAVSDHTTLRLYTGQKLDQRLKELGGTRVYACGDVAGSNRLGKTAMWCAGLLSLLTSMCESPLAGVDTNTSDEEGGGLKNCDSGSRNAARACDVSDNRAARLLLRRLHRLRAASPGDARRGCMEYMEGKSTELGMDPLCVSHGDGVQAEGGSVEEAEKGAEDARSSVSAEVGSCSSDVLTTHSCPTESSVTNRTVYTADSADVRAEGVVRSWKLLTCAAVRHPVVQLDLSVSTGPQWVPGQVISIFPSNSAAEVEALLRLFHLNYEEQFHPLALDSPDASTFPTSPLYGAVDFPVSCGMVLLQYVELRVTGVHKALFELLKRHCTCAEAKVAVQNMYEKLLTERTPQDLREVLEAVAAVTDSMPPFRHIVENLSLLQPRQYSICSSHRADATTLSICFKVVEKGLCTGWMYEQCLWAAGLPHAPFASATPSAVRQRICSNTVILAKRRVVIPFVIRSVSAFRMPLDPLVPMILIGSGTGIAPYRAFLQEREAWLMEHQLQSSWWCPKEKLCGCPHEEGLHHGHALCGSIHVFFGCRRRHEDYLFRDELAQWEDNGVVCSLTVAFSRDTNDGGLWYDSCYVQDKVQECGVAILDLILQQNAYVFVCGDADGMAREVHDTLRGLIQHRLSLTDAAAAKFLKQMGMEGRYLRDVWSTRMRK
ncbi:putative Flavodoxin/FAD binding domain/Oxidoreductase NAD-binding domain containing protein [Leishmania utingensis]|uniref:NADPH--hemoprotein reductase n=1 Tax=Leishmania utingensis TaxID=653362 RepID=A0AAW3B3K3_9TRYP